MPEPLPVRGGAESSIMRRLIVYKSRSAFSKALTSRYLKANIVNLIYAVIMMAMDVAVYSNELEGLVYLLLATIHCANAYMYLWVWVGERQDVFTMFCLPDWLNGVCALFYLGTGFCAPYMYDDYGRPSDIFYKVRRIELFLSVLECVAAAGWVYQWWAEFLKDLRLRPKQCRGRGWTFDDPDLWANLSLVIAALYYIMYNLIICIGGNEYYETSTLYFWGDFWYLINAICYILCALRDCECFWFMPLSGHFPDYTLVAEECGLLTEAESALLHGEYSSGEDSNSSDGDADAETGLLKGYASGGSNLSSRALGRQRSLSSHSNDTEAGGAANEEAAQSRPDGGSKTKGIKHLV